MSQRQSFVAGIDFGTSNSLVAVCDETGSVCSIPMENGTPVIPTTLFFNGRRHFFGQQAIDLYLSGAPGRFMRGIKSLLGSRTEVDGTYLGGGFVSFAELISVFLSQLKERTEAFLGQHIDSAVIGRPVHFRDDPDEDRQAQEILEKICYQIGFKNVSFQFEPVAAVCSVSHEVTHEEITFVADLGGGTSDFSVIRLHPTLQKNNVGNADVLSNDSIHLAGTDLDYKFCFLSVMPYFGKDSETLNNLPLPNAYFATASRWHEIRKLYTSRFVFQAEELLNTVKQPDLFGRYVTLLKRELGHYVLFETEQAKIDLTRREQTEADLCKIESDLFIPLTRRQFTDSTQTVCGQILDKARETLKQAGIHPDRIDSLVFTGGTSQVPVLAEGIRALCPNARVKKISTYESVGRGLAATAYARFMKTR